MKLATEFERAGLRVWFKGRLRRDHVSVHMAGPIVEIIAVEAL